MEVKTLSGRTKAAILLASLGRGESTQMLSRLSRTEADMLNGEMSRLGSVPIEVQRDVLEEFYRSATFEEDHPARTAPTPSPSDVSGSTEDEAPQERPREETEFQPLEEISPERIRHFLQNEHPQAGALVLAHLPPASAALVLSGLPHGERTEIITRMATLDQVSPDIMAEVESTMKAKFGDVPRARQADIDGTRRAAPVMRYVDRKKESEVMADLEEAEPDMARKIRGTGLTFDDIVRLNNHGIRNVLIEVDSGDLVIALSVSTDKVREAIYRNVSTQEAQLIKETIGRRAPVRVRDAERARSSIADVIRRLKDSGKIIVPDCDPEADRTI